MRMRLRRSDTASPGFGRVPAGDGFRFVDEAGVPLGGEEQLERLGGLAIPPAWRDVWISPDPRGHIQATGYDDAGRKQYLYHPQWRERRDRLKFDRALDLAEVLSGARGAVTRDLADPEPTRLRALALAFRLVDTVGVRIGSEDYLSANGSRGLCTLLVRHVRVDGDEVALRFPGKSGQQWLSSVRDAQLAGVLDAIARLRGPRGRLLSWSTAGSDAAGRPAGDRTAAGTWRSLSPDQVNHYIRERTHGDFTAKDFRTLHGTTTAFAALARAGQRESVRARDRAIAAAVRETAEALGNTPAIARGSYIDPRVLDRYRAGEAFALNRGTSPESGLLALLR